MIENTLTPEQVAEYLQLHPITVLRMIKTKKIKAYKIGRVYRILEKDLKEFLNKSQI
jgi:excisionase family DNA binding protein